MSVASIAALALVGYGAFVAVMEMAIGTVQPEMEGGVLLTTTDPDGATSSRKLAGFEFEGNLYIGSNHWLRGWYRRALAQPEVEVTTGGVTSQRIAVPVDGAEHARVATAYRMGFVLRLVCGFAPSRFLRLDPR